MAKASDEPKAGNHVAKEWITYREALARVRAAHVGYDDAAAHDALMRWLDACVVRCTDPSNRPLTSENFSRWTIMQIPGQIRNRTRVSPLDMWNETAKARLEQSRWWDVPVKPSASKGGRPPHSFWHVLGVEVGTWLTDEGAPETPEPVMEFMRQRLAHHGFHEPDDKRFGVWAERFLNTYRQYRGPKQSR